MSGPTGGLRWRILLRRLGRLALFLLPIFLILAAILPSLLPSSYVSSQIAAALSEATGRPVRVTGGSVGWFGGLRAAEIVIEDSSGGEFARIEKLWLDYEPWEMPALFAGGVSSLGRAHVERLTLRIVRHRDGRLNLPPGGTADPLPDFKSLEVAGGQIELLDEAAGRRSLLADIRLNIARLESGRKAYLTGSATTLLADQSADEPAGRVSFNGLLDNFDPRTINRIIGGLDVQWDGVNLGALLPPMSEDASLPLIVRMPSEGSASISIGSDHMINFEGSISASQMVVGQGATLDLAAEQTMLSFVGSYDVPAGRLQLAPLQLAGAGSSLRATGQLNFNAAGTCNGNLSFSGLVNWNPLKQIVPGLDRALSLFQAAAGTANVRQLDVRVTDDVAHIRGLIDMGRSELLLEPLFRKQSDRAAALVIDANVNLRNMQTDIRRLSLLLSPPSVPVEGLDVEPGEVTVNLHTQRQTTQAASRQQSQQIVMRIIVPDVTLLPRYLPLTANLISQFDLHGAAAITARVSADSPGRPVELTLDATALGFRTDDAAIKPVGEPLLVTVEGLLSDAGGLPRGQKIAIMTNSGELTWLGNIAVDADESHRADRGNWMTDGRLIIDGTLHLRDLEQWYRLVRPLLPQEPRIELAGNAEAQISGKIDNKSAVVKARLQLDKAAIAVGAGSGRVEVFVKPQGRPMQLRIDMEMARSRNWLLMQNEILLDSNRLKVTLCDFPSEASHMQPEIIAAMPMPTDGFMPFSAAHRLLANRRNAGGATIDLTLDAGDVDELLSLFPHAAERLAQYDPSGAFRLKVLARRGPQASDRLALSAALDATELTYLLKGHLHKTAGLQQRAEIDLRMPQQKPDGTDVVEISRFEARLGPSLLELSGRASFDADLRRLAARLPAIVLTVHNVEVAGRLALVQDDKLRRFSNWWNSVSDEHQIEGRADVQFNMRGSRKAVSMELSADATDAAFSYGLQTHKPKGVRASCAAKVDSGGPAGVLDIQNAHIALGDSLATCRGTLYSRSRMPRSINDIEGLSLHLEARSGELADLAQLVPWPQLRQLRPGGGVDLAIDIAADSFGAEIADGRIILDEMNIDYFGAPLSLSGRIDLDPQRLRIDGLNIKAGECDITLAADIASPLDRPRGSMAVSGTNLDLQQLLKIVRQDDTADNAPPAKADAQTQTVAAAHPAQGPPAAIPSTSPAAAASPTSSAATAATDAHAIADGSELADVIPEAWPPIQRFIARCNIDGSIALKRFIWEDEVGVTYKWQAFGSNFKLADGRLAVQDFKAAWRGGVVSGAVDVDMTQQNPQVHTRYAIRNIAAGPEIQPLINHQFPDMVVKGHINQVYDARRRLFASAASPSYPVGSTLFEAFNGTMSGQAAPKWLTDLIPGLNMTTYKFERMQSIGQLLADGRADNRMLFEGSPYALYIDGSTEADGAAVYTLGVDLMNSLQRGRAVRRLEQGRVPIMEFSGHIIDSAWHNLQVRFKLPHEVAYDVLLRRNLLLRLLDRSGESRRPDFTPYNFSSDAPPAAAPAVPATE